MPESRDLRLNALQIPVKHRCVGERRRVSYRVQGDEGFIQLVENLTREIHQRGHLWRWPARAQKALRLSQDFVAVAHFWGTDSELCRCHFARRSGCDFRRV